MKVDCPDVFKRLVDVSAHSGSVRFSADGSPGDVAQLNHATCSALDDLAEGRSAPLDPSVPRAVHVLAHEAFHLAGVRSEAAADCYAFQRSAYVAARLGSSLPEAQLLAQRALQERLVTAPPDYRSSECRNGGGLDLDHERGSWP